jgi:hypothetical protein
MIACSVVGAQPTAWRGGANGGVPCLSAPAPNGPPDPATGCPTAIDTAGRDFAALDSITGSGGPHRYVFEPTTTAAERSTHATACCYLIEYPPPPGG